MKLIHLVLIWNDTKGLQIAKKLKFWEDGDLLGGFEWSKNAFRTAPPPLFCYTCVAATTFSQIF